MRTGGLEVIRARCSRALLVSAACAIAPLFLAPAGAAFAQRGRGPTTRPPQSSAALQQCVTAVVQTERSATFAGEMSAVAGTARMAMRIDVQERISGEPRFHAILAPGLGVWRVSDPKVKIYMYLKQVTNLSAPAEYRALVRFRWLAAKGRVIKREQRLTPSCDEPPAPPAAPALSS